MKKVFRLAAAIAAFGIVLALSACSNGSDDNAALLAALAKTTYTVSIADGIQNGSVAADPASAAAGATVTLTATPAACFELSSLAVTAADNSAVTTSGSGNTRTFTMPKQNVTVSATFFSPIDYKKVGETTIESTTYDLVTFGLWPQTIKADSVTVDENVTETHGAFTYCKGSDGEWYVKQAENAYDALKYSDGTTAGQGGKSEKWFKVEPIKWRVLTTNYGGNKLLLAESVLTNSLYYLNTKSRAIDGATVYANNYKYSTIRAYLNGSYEIGDDQAKTHAGKGFLQSAFTSEQQAAIKTTAVDNTARSTNPDANATQWNSGENEYASDPTNDKIFLLSLKEVTTNAYGFAAYDKGIGDKYGTTSSTRIRQATDFAKATGANQRLNEDSGGDWWLRSPDYNMGSDAYYVGLRPGAAYADYYVSYSYFGVVPALCLPN